MVRKSHAERSKPDVVCNPLPPPSDTIEIQMTKFTDKFLVVAASCRSIARSITESGRECAAIDLFGDWDSRQLCPISTSKSLGSMIRDSREFGRKFSVVYGAGIENEMLERQSPFGELPVCGSSHEAVSASRDPYFLASILRAADLPCLSLAVELPGNELWLEKPLRSGGGCGVRVASVGDSRTRQRKEVYYQQFVEGSVFGASYIAGRGACQLIGVCQQDAGGLAGEKYVFHGSLGPVGVSDELRHRLVQLGELISRQCGLKGWFGIDYVLKDGIPWLLEVNPRFTASMEILERCSGASLFDYHLGAVGGRQVANWPSPSTYQSLGKRYVYHRQSHTVSIDEVAFDFLKERASDANEFVTDIPELGTTIKPGWPICTVWSRHDSAEVVSERLLRLEAEIVEQVASAPQKK